MIGLGAKVCSRCKLRFECPIVRIIHKIKVGKLTHAITIDWKKDPYELTAFYVQNQNEFQPGIMKQKFKDNGCLISFGTAISFNKAESDEDGTIGYEYFGQQNIFYIKFDDTEAGRLARNITESNFYKEPPPP